MSYKIFKKSVLDSKYKCLPRNAKSFQKRISLQIYGPDSLSQISANDRLYIRAAWRHVYMHVSQVICTWRSARNVLFKKQKRQGGRKSSRSRYDVFQRYRAVFINIDAIQIHVWGWTKYYDTINVPNNKLFIIINSIVNNWKGKPKNQMSMPFKIINNYKEAFSSQKHTK